MGAESGADDGAVIFFDIPSPPSSPVPPVSACSEASAVLDVTSATTPFHGPLVIVDAFASYDYCSGWVYVALVSEDTGDPQTPILRFLTDRASQPDPAGTLYSGKYDTRRGGPSVPVAVDAIEFVDEWDAAEALDEGADPIVHVRLELHVDGWDVSVEAEVPFCGDWLECFCPCE